MTTLYLIKKEERWFISNHKDKCVPLPLLSLSTNVPISNLVSILKQFGATNENGHYGFNQCQSGEAAIEMIINKIKNITLKI